MQNENETQERPLEFVLVAEKGVLERQALLLCESIRLFAGKYASCAITVVSPRPSRRPSPESVMQLERLGCAYLPLDVQNIEPEYGTTFRMYVSAEVEKTSKAAVLVVMDSDLLFASEPDLALHECSAALRPVDVPGMCTREAGDQFNGYWRALCETTGVDYNVIPLVETTVGNIEVKASYNGGLVIADRACGIFGRTLQYFQQSIEAGLSPNPGTIAEFNAGHGRVSGRAAELWGSSQACLSLAIWGSDLRVRTPPKSHNFPLHLFYHLQSADQKTPLSIVHYHNQFDLDPQSNPLLNGSANVSPLFSKWIMTKSAHYFPAAQ